MQTTQTLIMAVFLVTMAACSKQESIEASIEESTVQKPMETASANNAETEKTKLIVRLPNEIDANDLSGANVEQDGSGKKVLYWEDPMVSDRHFSKSGPSPFMDMKLEPKYAE
jgi:uncharacterized lipoprotein